MKQKYCRADTMNNTTTPQKLSQSLGFLTFNTYLVCSGVRIRTNTSAVTNVTPLTHDVGFCSVRFPKVQHAWQPRTTEDEIAAHFKGGNQPSR